MSEERQDLLEKLLPNVTNIGDLIDIMSSLIDHVSKCFTVTQSEKTELLLAFQPTMLELHRLNDKLVPLRISDVIIHLEKIREEHGDIKAGYYYRQYENDPTHTKFVEYTKSQAKEVFYVAQEGDETVLVID